MNERAIMKGLQTLTIGRSVHVFESVESTNDTARGLAEQGAPHGTVVIAHGQRRGRGRQGRAWASPPGGLWLSVVLRPRQPMAQWPRLAFATAVGIASAMERQLGIRVGLKWPNDFMLDGRKLGGVLLEAAPSYVIVGVGLNINIPTDAFPAHLSAVATSFEASQGHSADLVALTQETLRQLESTYATVETDAHIIMEQWRARSVTIGTPIRIVGPADAYEGIAEGIDDDGGLLLRTETGLRRLVAGDVSVRSVEEARP